jgi:CheY-like chemotaxis protein
MPVPPPVVAVINTSPDVVDMLRLAIERAGIVVVSALTHEIREGLVDLESFVKQHQPQVVVYDIAPPYTSNWTLFQHLRNRPPLKDRTFILTSTNAHHVRDLAGSDTKVYEIVGKPFDLDELVQAVREALHARPVR